MANEVKFNCDAIGIAGTTDVYCRAEKGKFECRVGIAIMGTTNMSNEELEVANPFDDDFAGNYAVGYGITREAALKDMKNSMKETANSIWRI